MKQNKLLTLFVSLIYIFIFTPLVIIAATAFGSKEYVTFPPQGFSFRWFSNVFTSGMFTRTFLVSFKVAVVGVGLALLIGIPAAYVLSKYKFPLRGFLKSLFISPLIVPGVVFGFALFRFSVIKLQLPIERSLLIGHTLITLPYVIRVVSSGLENFDFTIEEAAMSLGCTGVKSFFIVVLPNITSSIIAAFMLSFINSFNNVPISMFLTGPGVSTLPITMMSYVEYYYDPTVSAISVLLMLMTVGIMFVIEKTLGLSYFAK